MAAPLVNLNNAHTMRGSYREAIRTGPYSVDIALPPGTSANQVRLLATDQEPRSDMVGGRLVVEVPGVVFHEVVAVELDH